MSGKIPESNIVLRNIIEPEQLLNVTNALRGEANNDIYISGSLTVTGSHKRTISTFEC